MSGPRRYDHDEAYARWLAGETFKEIAASYGVNQNAIRQLAKLRDPEQHEELKRYHRKYQRRQLYKPCVRGCGRMAWHNYGRAGVCRRCRADEAATSVRDDELRCGECREWKPDEAFPLRTRGVARRGRHSVCRSCQTAVKARSRARHKTPCKNCGEPRLADPRNADSGLCLRCWRERRSAAA